MDFLVDDDDFVVPISSEKSKSKVKTDCGPNKPEPFTCAKCQIVFRQKRNLAAHLRNMKCDMQKNNLHIRPAAAVHSGAVNAAAVEANKPECFACDKCGTLFKYKRNLTEHSLKCHLRKQHLHKCPAVDCVLTFYHKTKLTEHIKLHHADTVNAAVTEPQSCMSDVSSFACAKCNRYFKSKFNLNRHSKASCVSVKAKRQCYVPGCSRKFYHEVKLIEHLEIDHLETVKDSKMSFKTMGEFLDWRESEQTSKYVYLSKVTGKAIGSYTYSYYVCQHDGPRRRAIKPKSSRKARRGSARFGKTCPARLLVKENHDSGSVSVRYICVHSHEYTFANTKFHPLSRETKSYIRKQLSMGLPAKQIRDSLCESAGLRENRGDNIILRKENFIQLRTIREMERKLKLRHRLHSDDATSVLLTVKKLQCEQYDPILIYKPFGEDIVIGNIEMKSLPDFHDLFLFGFQTREQRDCLKEFATKILCVDSTHCTNQYGYQLLNLVVQDETRKSYPVGHLISSRMNEQVLHFFFAAVKEKCPDLVINAVMTDDDNAPWNAIVSVFGSSFTRHLLCTWHVLRAWSCRLRSSTLDTQLRQEMFTALRVILYCNKEPMFRSLIDFFCQKYSFNCPTFVEYFKSFYCKRVELWAMCFRNFAHGNTNTNMLVESFHNRLKTFYMNRTPNKRLDDLIDLLLRMEKDDFLRRTKHHVYNESESFNAHESKVRHDRGLKISDGDIFALNVDNDNISSSNEEAVRWEVRSQSKPDVVYDVTLVSFSCNVDLCMQVCLELCCSGLCAHMFSCSCQDKSGICKHIHKVQSFRVRVSERAYGLDLSSDNIAGSASNIDDTVSNDANQIRLYDAPTGPIAYVANNDAKSCELIHTLLEKIKLYSGNSSVKELFPHLIGNLSNMVAQCEAVIEMHAAPLTTEMAPSTICAPNEKLQKQPAPKRMNRLSTKRNKTFLPKLSRTDKVAALSALCQVQSQTIGDEHDLSVPSSDLTANLGENSNVSYARVIEPPSLLNTNSSSNQQKMSSNRKTNAPPTSDLIEENSITVPLLYNSENVGKSILNIGQNLSMIELKTLEYSLPHSVYAYLKMKDSNFVTGWVTDPVIDAFLLRLSQVRSHVLHAGSCFCRLLLSGTLRGSECDQLWEGESLETKSIFFFPVNYTNNHWALFVADINKLTIAYINPMETGSVHKQFQTFKLIQDLLSLHVTAQPISWKWVAPHRTLQTDSVNCGVFVMWYAFQLAHALPITDHLDPNEFRRFAFQVIAGNCMQRSHFSDETCRICHHAHSLEPRVQCKQCKQWFHCDCVGVPIADSQCDGYAFVCPQ